MRVFVKRYPSKGELPSEDNKDYCSNIGMVYFRKHKFYFRDEQLITFTDKVEWWLEEIELPSDDEILDAILIKQDKDQAQFMRGIDFILNHLKSNANG